jgi:hypothetical protein
MPRQLTLIEISPDWRLDDRTREIGRRGVARARAALAAAHGTAPPPPDATSSDAPGRRGDCAERRPAA